MEFIREEVLKLQSFHLVNNFEGENLVKVIGQKVTTPSPSEWATILPGDNVEYEEHIQTNRTLKKVITFYGQDLG